MFERILARVLKDVLGQWVKDFNEKNLKLGAFSGNVQLHNLELRVARIREHNLLHASHGLMLGGCAGLAALYDLKRREGMPALLAHIAAQAKPLPAAGAS